MRKTKWALFLLCSLALVISLFLALNMGLYVDEHNTSPSAVLGGDFYLGAYWLRLLFLLLMTGLSLKLLIEK